MVLGFIGFVGFGVVYWVGDNTQWEAATLGFGMLFLGFGVITWGKYLMPQGPFVEERHDFHSTDAERTAFAAAITERGGMVVKRRKMLGGLFAAGSGVLGIVLLFPLLRSLGPKPGHTLFETNWKKGAKLVAIDGRQITVDDLEVGGVLTVFPRGYTGSSPDQVILIRLGPQGPFDPPCHLDPPGPHRLDRPGLRGLLEDVHPPGLPGGPLPGADPAAGVPVPSVHLQRQRRSGA